MILDKQVAVIGAGIAGLSCATALQRAGANVTVFEKSRGVSGRLSTRVVQAADLTQLWQCDHGAQYFTARDPVFNVEVQRWIQADVAQLWQPRLMVLDGNKLLNKESETKRFVGYPRNNSPAKWLAQSLNIHTETTVTRLQMSGQQCLISSTEHGVNAQKFDAVILAIPAPQATVLLKDISPNLYALAANVKMHACFSLMLNVENKLHCDFDGLFINNGLLRWIARDSAKPGRMNSGAHQARTQAPALETWVSQASSQWSEIYVNEDKEVVAEQMLAEFTRIINLQYPNMFEPHSYSLHRWLYADCEDYLNCAYQLDRQNNIGICGDWLNGGKVQGAWLSGLMIAKQLIAINL